MKYLFCMECKKTLGSILYWLYVVALAVTSIHNYDTVVKGELGRTDDPVSVFYTAENGIYADAADELDEAAQRAMMIGATKRLLGNYRDNRYEYYPFGYVKEKRLGKKEQAVVLLYLKELTGLSEAAIAGRDESDGAKIVTDSPEPDNSRKDESGGAKMVTDSPEPDSAENDKKNNIEDIQISGGGAFILKPGQGGDYENGRFIVEPDDWEYVENPSGESEALGNSSENSAAPENPSGISGTPERLSGISGTPEHPSGKPKSPENPSENPSTLKHPENTFEIQVSFSRFKTIMDKVNDLIGRNSYYSQTMLSMYYFRNDMQDTPITEQQHREFYEKDHVTGAFARYFCDSISLIILCLPAFVIIDLLLKDKRHNMKALIAPRTADSGKIIFARFLAVTAMAMLPVLLLPLRSLVTLILYCHSIGVHVDVFAFAIYIFAWIFPTVLFVVAVALFVTVLTENYSAVLPTGLIWLFGRPTIDKMAGGNYGIFDLVIRHNTLKGYGRMMENIQMLVLNRLLISVIALLLVGIAVIVYDAKRKGGIVFGNKKFSDAYRRKHSHEF